MPEPSFSSSTWRPHSRVSAFSHHQRPERAIVARLHRARARRAADAREGLRVEAVHRHVVVADVLPHLVGRPVGERVDLPDPAVALVELDLADVVPRHVLIAAQAGHVRVEPGEELSIRLDLAQTAAEPPLLERLVEEVHPVLAHHLLERDGVRVDDLDRLVVAIAHAIDEVVGRLRKATGIEHVDARRRLDAVHHVDQRHAFGIAERARQGEARVEFLDRPGEDFLRAPAFRFEGRRFREILLDRGACLFHESSVSGAETMQDGEI